MLEKQMSKGILAAILIGLASTCMAEAMDESLSMVYYVDVKPGHETAFYDAVKAHAQKRLKEEDPWTWYVYQVIVGENLGQYIIRSGGHTWACFDRYDAFSTRLSEDWNKNVGPHIARITNKIGRDDLELTRGMEEGTFGYAQVVQYDLKPGHKKDFSEAIKKYHETIAEHDYDTSYVFIWTMVGGDATDVTLALPFENYAAMEGPEEKLWAFIQRVLGDKAAEKLGEQFSGSILSSKDFLIRAIPELSVIHKE